MVKVPQAVKGPRGGKVVTRQYATKYGAKTKTGHVVYKGKHHHHWSRKCYMKKWNCWSLYCPSTGQWFYWSEDRQTYLPLRYLNVVAPAVGNNTPNVEEVENEVQQEAEDIPEPGQ